MNMRRTAINSIGAIFFLAVAILNLTACESSAKDWSKPNMTALTPRLQQIFEKTKSVCFGRFIVDVPESASVAWGSSTVALDIAVYPDGLDKVEKMEAEFVNFLKNTQAIYHERVPLLLAQETVAQPAGNIVVGYEEFDAVNGLKINGYFKSGHDGFVVKSRPLREDAPGTIAEIKSIAKRLQLRKHEEIPSEPGNCLEFAFLPDAAQGSPDPSAEHIRIGFRLKEFPDTHLSILIGPSNPHYSESDSLEWQLKKIEKRQRAENSDHPLLKTKYFRRGPREIAGWPNGWEGLSRSPDSAEAHGIHDFALAVKGVPSDPFQPFVDIRMQTGVGGNTAGAMKPSLTDAEAVAVWDKITSTIRVRPTGTAPVKTSSIAPTPRLPLGELAATGRACPQSGWWQAAETGAVDGERRRHFNAGEPMPDIVLVRGTSLWEKLKGTQNSYRTATVWKLVDYGDMSVASGSTVQDA